MRSGRSHVFGVLFGLGALLVAVSSANAEEKDWAQRMFSELEHDFGTVASGSDARHQITVKNLYKEQIRIVNVGTTCGCTAAKPSQDVLETGETAYIEVVMNTVFRMFGDSAAARGDRKPEQVQASSEQVALAALMKGVHF